MKKDLLFIRVFACFYRRGVCTRRIRCHRCMIGRIPKKQS